jgi:hypothetical protein
MLVACRLADAREAHYAKLIVLTQTERAIRER